MAARSDAIAPSLLHGWMTGRSLARRLPPPIPDRGGFRVETGLPDEVRRYVFPSLTPGLVEVGREIAGPLQPIKLCGPMTDLLGALPAGWAPRNPAFFMRGSGAWRRAPLPAGYAVAIEEDGPVAHVRITTRDGLLAASGFAANAPDAFVYDRVATHADHRRRGLGSAVMNALRETRKGTHRVELLTATGEGRRLYESLGWRLLSPYSTAVRA